MFRLHRRAFCAECGYRAPGHDERCGQRLVDQAREQMIAADPRI
jgi:hypothetical protein